MDMKNATHVVQTTRGALVDGYPSLESAEASATERNTRAEAMGLKSRYEAAPNPNKKRGIDVRQAF